eukprot:1965945-Rhodomonas_salina.1
MVAVKFSSFSLVPRDSAPVPAVVRAPFPRTDCPASQYHTGTEKLYSSQNAVTTHNRSWKRRRSIAAPTKNRS